MLKGVNRQVVEIPQPQSRYFEKIILFVKPEFSGLPQARLSRAALPELPEALPPLQTGKARGGRLRRALRGLLCAGAGAAALALLELIFR